AGEQARCFRAVCRQREVARWEEEPRVARAGDAGCDDGAHLRHGDRPLAEALSGERCTLSPSTPLRMNGASPSTKARSPGSGHRLMVFRWADYAAHSPSDVSGLKAAVSPRSMKSSVTASFLVSASRSAST